MTAEKSKDKDKGKNAGGGAPRSPHDLATRVSREANIGGCRAGSALRFSLFALLCVSAVICLSSCAHLVRKDINIAGEHYTYVFGSCMDLGASIAVCDRFDKDGKALYHDSAGGPGAIQSILGSGTTQGLFQGALQSSGIPAAPEVVTIPGK